MRSRSMVFASLCLVACTKAASPETPAIDISEAAKAEDLTDGTLFDFEQGRSKADATRLLTEGSNVFAALGANAQRFPGNVALGPFRIGMTIGQVEQLALARSYSLVVGQDPDTPDAECSTEPAAGGKPLILNVVPRRLELSADDGESYSLEFMDDAGQARVTAITWAPASKAFTSASWATYLARTYGKPSFRDVSADYATLQWCSTGESLCAGDRNGRLPVLTASDDRLGKSISISLSAGADLEDAGPRIAARSDDSRGATCPRSLTQGEARLYANYLASLHDSFAPDAPTVFRRTRLPTGLQQALLSRLGRPDWFKIVGNDFVARYDVYYSGDPASRSEIKYVAFSSPDGKAFQAVWQGDETMLRNRYAMPGTPVAGGRP